MNIEELYKELEKNNVENYNGALNIRTGLFKEEDLIKIFDDYTTIYFKIDKNGLMEVMNTFLEGYAHLQKKDSYNHMVDILTLIQDTINDYYGTSKQDERLRYYMLNGKTIDEDTRICQMSQIKGAGVARCAEKASAANNMLLLLNRMGIFDYQVSYVEGLASLNTETFEGHAFLKFDRIKTDGKTLHIIYDVTNPEIVSYNGDDYYYPALYGLNDDEYQAFLEGKPFDNSKFLVGEFYKVKEPRKYFGYANEMHK